MIPPEWTIDYKGDEMLIYEDDSKKKLIMKGNFNGENSGERKEFDGLEFYSSYGGMHYSSSSYMGTLEYISKVTDTTLFVQFISVLSSSNYIRYNFHSEPNCVDADTARIIAQSYVMN